MWSETKFPRCLLRGTKGKRERRRKRKRENREREREEGVCSIDQSAISNAELLIGYRFIADGKSGTACYRVQIRRLNHVKRRCLTTMVPDQLAANESSTTPDVETVSPWPWSCLHPSSFQFVRIRCIPPSAIIFGRNENDIGGKLGFKFEIFSRIW